MLGPLITTPLTHLKAAHGALTGRTGPLQVIPRRWGGAGPWLWLGPLPAGRSQIGGHAWRAGASISPDDGLVVRLAHHRIGSAIFGFYPSHRKCLRALDPETLTKIGDVIHVGRHGRWGPGSSGTRSADGRQRERRPGLGSRRLRDRPALGGRSGRRHGRGAPARA